MSNPDWNKRARDEPFYEGVRSAEFEELGLFDLETQAKIEIILSAMDVQQLIVFNYDGSDRVVAPFVVGVSSDVNPLLRGFQIEGNSRSGKGVGWRVFQVYKIINIANHQDFFSVGDFEFDSTYPWIYRVFKTL